MKSKLLPFVSPGSEKDTGMADHAMCLVGVTLSFSWFISALALLVFWTDDDTSLRPRPFLLDGLFNYVLSVSSGYLPG
ncbi:Uncharacterized protein HZ326_14935 [Fusarium oxysporum f. sp. albedinis]|nr:Uncharacterized protein HZ326_14935 [Fusarium oxysporum f. sp. albedinis]